MGKARGMGAGRKLKQHMICKHIICKRLAYKNSPLGKKRFLEKHLGNEWKKPCYGPGPFEVKNPPACFPDGWWNNVEEIGPVMRKSCGLRYKLMKYNGVWLKAILMGTKEKPWS